MPAITTDIIGTSACAGATYTATVDCGPDDIVEWSSPLIPGNTGGQVVFSNPNGATTEFTLPGQGTFGIRAVCRTPA